MSKMLGYLITLVGIVAAVGGYVLWHAEGFSSKKLDAALGVGVILLLLGLFMAFAPARQRA